MCIQLHRRGNSLKNPILLLLVPYFLLRLSIRQPLGYDSDTAAPLRLRYREEMRQRERVSLQAVPSRASPERE